MTAEWVLTEASIELLDDLGADPRTSRLTTLYGHDSMRERLEQVERAAVARADIDLETARMVIAEFERVLTVDNVARALSTLTDGVCPSSCPDEAHHREDAEALIAALTEDVL